jgi:hypothetical protein
MPPDQVRVRFHESRYLVPAPDGTGALRFQLVQQAPRRRIGPRRALRVPVGDGGHGALDGADRRGERHAPWLSPASTARISRAFSTERILAAGLLLMKAA